MTATMIKRFFVFLLIFPSLFAQTPFSSDSALSYLKTISVTIGPRPMGSPHEQQAMEFALTKFREFGLNETYLMEMQTAENDVTHSSINTNSGVAVGVLHGKTKHIIIIGAHIDSASPFIPGANDDGSGSAAVIELARVLSKEQHQSTIVFCLFSGEETGLCGSKYFINHYLQIDSVALMLNLDMANGSELLMPIIDNKSGNTPIWLVQAAYEEFEKLGYSRLYYPTHFFTAVSILPGGIVRSDYMPFLEKDIPAISFSSDLNDPIHTPQDNFEHFKPGGLKRSGGLLYALVHRYDQGVPAEKSSDYYFLQIGRRVLFFPLWLLSAFIIFSVILAIIILVNVRKRQRDINGNQHPKIPALKLFLVALFIQTCVWLSEIFIGLMKGVRYPWVANPEGYFVLGFLAALIGITISLKLIPRINISHDPYRWFLRAVLFLLVFISLLSFTNVKLAWYPSFALCFISLAMIVRNPWLKVFLWIISPHCMFRLIFSEGFLFFGRMSALYSQGGIGISIIAHAMYILFFSLWSFPFLLSFAAIYFDSHIDLFWLKRWRTQHGFLIAIAAFLLCAIILTCIPSYSDEWQQNISIIQSVNVNTGKGKVTLKSSEYLKDLKVRLADKDTNVSTWDREFSLSDFTYDRAPWIQVQRTVTTSADSNTTFDLLIKLHFKYRPQDCILSYSAGKNKMEDISGLFITHMTDHSVSMRWESFPDTFLLIPIHFKVDSADSVVETIEARFIELMEPVCVKKELVNIIPQTILQRTEVIKHER
jgi:hypothetical protein